MSVAEQFDHFAPEWIAEPYELWRELREREPVARSSAYGGFRVLSRYEDIVAAAQDPDTFSSTDGIGIPRLPVVGMIPIDFDPPVHRKYRAIINPALSVNAIARHEAHIREIVAGLVEPMVAAPVFDAAVELAIPLPPQATLSFVGFPEAEHAALGRASRDIARERGGGGERFHRAGEELVSAAMSLLERRRAEPLADDLISLLLAGEVDGRPLEDWEIVQCVFVLVLGAVDTTANAIAGSLYWLAQHPEQAQALRACEQIPNLAVEELLRWTSPIQGLSRTCRRDTEIAGCPVQAGERVMLHWGSGNRDTSQFTDPENVDLARKPNKHLAFGMGPHRCVGVHMGKLVLRLALEEFLTRVEAFELADPSAVAWEGGESRGISRLPLRRL